MAEFADQTGLTPVGRGPHRYLWTDAFAVCNFLELYRQTGDDNFKSLALLLVDQVHNTLGRHREDDARSGWISGLDEDEGRLHPIVGGLRIGKKLNERSPSDPFDDKLEWDRDGQYYHYLTKWMHALNYASMVTADPAVVDKARRQFDHELVVTPQTSTFFLTFCVELPPFDDVLVRRAFAHAVEKLIADPERREKMGRYNREYARQRFAASRVAKRIEQIYHDVLRV